MNKSLSIILLSLTLMGLSTPANAALPWIILTGRTTAPDVTPDPDLTPPPFTPDTLWLTDDHLDLSDVPDSAHSGYTIRQIDSVFDYLENKYPDYLPSHQTSYYDQGYRVRYYADNSGGYLHAINGSVRFSNKKNSLVVKTVEAWLKLLKAEREEDIEVVFNFLEKSYPDQFPSHQETYYKDGKSDEDRSRTRYYPSVDGYLTVKDKKVTSSNEDDDFEVKTLDQWLKVSQSQRDVEVELVFNYLQNTYPDYFPSKQKTRYLAGYRIRDYPTYLGHLFFKGENVSHISFSKPSHVIETKSLDYWVEQLGIPPTVKKDRLIEVDLVFNWLEENFRRYFPTNQKSYNKDGSWTRYYPSKDGYLFMKNDHVNFAGYDPMMGHDSLESWLQHSGVKVAPGTDQNVPPSTSHPKYTTKHIDLIFDHLEDVFPRYFPTHQKSYYKDGHRTRYYPSKDGYLYIDDDSNVAVSGYLNIMETNHLSVWAALSGIKENPDINDSVFPVTPLRMATKSHINLLYDWFEENYPEHFPLYQASYEWLDGYWTRYYPSTESYLTSKDGYVYFSDNIKEEMVSDSLDYWFEYSGVAKQEQYRLTDLLFDWMEKEYSHYLPSHQESYNEDGVRTRYYPSDDTHLFVENGKAHLHRHDGDEKEEVFSLEVWLDYSGIAAYEKSGEDDRVEAQRLEAERKEAFRPEAESLEAERPEAERIEAELTEAERVEAARVEAARVEAARVEAERMEVVRLEVEAAKLEAERVDAERVEAERVEAERVEAERVEAERVEAERVEAEKAEAARIEAERQAEHPDYSFSQIDLLFDWLEKTYPQYFPSSQQSYYEDGYRTRYYPSVDTYLYVKDSRVHMHIVDKYMTDFSLDDLFERLGIAED